MAGIGLWLVENGPPSKLSQSGVGLEAYLEEWIEHDPTMLEHGLVIVGRQLRTKAGPLDLLALDPQGRWVLVEIKRDKLRRDVIAQAIDYAACLKELDSETLAAMCDAYLKKHAGGSLWALLNERGRSIDVDDAMELVIYLVGTSMDSGLDRMVDYLGAESNFVIRVVTFSVFEDGVGRKLLAREILERESEPARSLQQTVSSLDLETLKSQARTNGLGESFEILVQAGINAGLYPRLWKNSVMFAPPSNRTRCLFTVWTGKQSQPGVAKVAIGREAFEDYMNVPQDTVAKALGLGYVELNPESAREFANSLQRIMKSGEVDQS